MQKTYNYKQNEGVENSFEAANDRAIGQFSYRLLYFTSPTFRSFYIFQEYCSGGKLHFRSLQEQWAPVIDHLDLADKGTRMV